MQGALITGLAPLFGGVWVRSRRRRYRRIGREFLTYEHAALEGFFDESLLRRVRVAVVKRIEPPLVGSMVPLRRFGSLVDLSTVRGMAFGDAIVLSVDPPGVSLLFHEMVHVVQYELYGVGPMLRRYVGDYFRTGRDYLAIDAERCAYQLQARFEAAPTSRFSVSEEVRAMMG